MILNACWSFSQQIVFPGYDKFRGFVKCYYQQNLFIQKVRRVWTEQKAALVKYPRRSLTEWLHEMIL